jgi:Zinc carboxypeptidase
MLNSLGVWWRQRRYQVVVFLCVLAAGSVNAQQTLPTPLEKAGFSRISQSGEISAFLQAVVQQDRGVTLTLLGKSVQGRPIEALEFAARTPGSLTARPRVMIIGTQHGAAEPAGGEALLVLARELVSGDLQHLREHLDIILIPNANPDGRDLARRSNANRININTDFVTVNQPETQILKAALQRMQPDVVLDSHESAILKRETLAKQGYLTDFYAQFESANNPGIPASTRALAYDVLLPAMIENTSKAGLPAHRYIGEIISIHQPITNGGLTVQNFRNTAGISGSLSFLLETRLDSREDKHATYRNIRERVDRQMIALRAFLDTVYQNRTGIMQEVARMRSAALTEPLPLKSRYVLDMGNPEVAIDLRRLDTRKLETLTFADHRLVDVSDTVTLPPYLAVNDHVDVLRPFLDKHQVQYRQLKTPLEVSAIVNRYTPPATVKEGAALSATTEKVVLLDSGALLIDMQQPLGRMAMLLLDPRSTSSAFRQPPFAPLLVSERDFFILQLRQAPGLE